MYIISKIGQFFTKKSLMHKYVPIPQNNKNIPISYGNSRKGDNPRNILLVEFPLYDIFFKFLRIV